MAGEYVLNSSLRTNLFCKNVGQYSIDFVRICNLCFFKHFFFSGNGGEIQWCFSQVKGTVEEDITEGKIWLRHSTTKAEMIDAEKSGVNAGWCCIEKLHSTKQLPRAAFVSE